MRPRGNPERKDQRGLGMGGDKGGRDGLHPASADTGTQPPRIHPIGHSARVFWRDGLPLSLIRKGLWLHTLTHTYAHTYCRGREEQSYFIYRYIYVYPPQRQFLALLAQPFRRELPTFCLSPPQRDSLSSTVKWA